MRIDGNWLKENFPELKGKYIGLILRLVKEVNYLNDQEAFAYIKVMIDFFVPKQIPLQDAVKPTMFLDSGDFDSPEFKNYDKVYDTLLGISKTPTVRQIAVMPDACPTGEKSVPVGTVIKAENAIHPGWHSADVCCSLMVTNLGVKPEDYPKDCVVYGNYLHIVMDALNSITHFGPGSRPNGKRFTISPRLYKEAMDNPFLNSTKSLQMMQEHLGTQGDGNHFAYVGTLASTGEICIVTHHGSRGFGAGLYKQGMTVAEKYRKEISPETAKENAWIPFDTEDGRNYWDALQIVRKWTKANHNSIHQAVCDSLGIKHTDRFWNEHNFVFHSDRDEGMFFHAKGATPVHDRYLPDTDGRTIIPLNMREPILISKTSDKCQFAKTMGFAPHGAGRLVSRTKHTKTVLENSSIEEVFAKETKGLDIRFYSGNVDVSELPSAYKNAEKVVSEIQDHNLCEVIDRIEPYGSIMAGDWQKDAKWRKKKSQRLA